MSRPAAEADHEVRSGELDGVPVFWCDAPGAFTGALLFRVGRSDEELKTGGITHLVEHLAIHPLDPPPHPFGGLVDETRTVFHARGTPTEVTDYLAAVCTNLGRLPLERLEEERRVLRAEAGGATAHPLWPMRFGPRHQGLVGYPQYGLEWLSAEQIEEWAQSRFTRENAALWFSGSPPEDLRLELARGSRFEPPEPRGISGLKLPAWDVSHDGGMWISLLCERSTVMYAGAVILGTRLQTRLRRELGMSYAAGSDYWRLHRRWAHVLVAADAAPGRAQAVRDGFVEVLDEFAHAGPKEEELERYLALFERQSAEPEGVPGLLDAYASNHLVGAPTPSRTELLDEIRAFTPAGLAEDFASAFETMIALVPPGLAFSAFGAVPYRPAPDREPVRGTDYNPGTAGHNETITVGESGVTRRVGQESTTILFEDCELVVLEGSHAVSLISTAGESIWFQYRGEEATEQILGAIEAAVPSDRILRAEEEAQLRLDELVALADEKLGNHESWALMALPHVLFAEETALNLARGRWGEEEALLVLTDARLLVISSDGQRLLDEVLREQVVSVNATRGLRSGELAIGDGRIEHRYRSVSPRGRVAEFERELGDAER